MKTDNRPDPKPRSNPQLWQSFLWWRELTELRKKHLLRISSSERGKSNLDAEFERQMIELINLDTLVAPKNKLQKENSVLGMIINYGKLIPVWDWMLSHKGIGESLAGQLLAQIDDIKKFETVSKLWRYCGYGVYKYWVDESGKIQAPISGWKWSKNKEGNRVKQYNITLGENDYGLEFVNLPLIEPDEWVLEEVKYNQAKDGWKLINHRDINVAEYHSPYNNLLKSTVFLVGDQFIKQQSSPWVEIYYDWKRRKREEHPEKIKTNGKWKWNDSHIHMWSMRKMEKRFLKELWIEWNKVS